jgi:hypothetical protein
MKRLVLVAMLAGAVVAIGGCAIQAAVASPNATSQPSAIVLHTPYEWQTKARDDSSDTVLAVLNDCKAYEFNTAPYNQCQQVTKAKVASGTEGRPDITVHDFEYDRVCLSHGWTDNQVSECNQFVTADLALVDEFEINLWNVGGYQIHICNAWISNGFWHLDENDPCLPQNGG